MNELIPDNRGGKSWDSTTFSDSQRMLGVVEAAYEKYAYFALRPMREGEIAYEPPPITRRERVRMFILELKYDKMQMLHDWTEKKGARCPDNY